MKVAELFAELGFKTNPVDKMRLGDLVRTIEDLNLSTVLAALGVSGLALGIANLSEAAAKFGHNLKGLSVITGIDPKVIQQWEQLGEQFGVSTQEMDSALKSLTDQGYDFRQVFSFLEKGFKNWSPMVRHAQLSAFGLSDSFAVLFNEGEKVTQMLKDQSTITGKQAADLDRVQRSMIALSQHLMTGAYGAVATVMGAMLPKEGMGDWATLKAMFMGITPSPLAALAFAGGTPSGQNIIHIAMDIHGATDPVAVGKKVVDEIKKAIAHAYYSGTQKEQR